MHKFRSNKTLLKLRLGSFLFILLFFCLALLVPAVVWEVILQPGNGLQYTITVLAATFVSALGYLLIGSGVRCPLCHGPVIGKPSCARNHRAARMLGSYRLAVATRVLFLGCFRCPCCGEPCKCEARY